MKYFTNSACSLLKGLMCKNVKNRLGAQRMKDIQEHAWFRTIDFGLLEAGYWPAPIAPNQDEINADSLRHIGKSPTDDKYKNVKITAQFERSLKAFNYVSMNALQEEMVCVLKKVNENYSFDRFSMERYAGERVSVSQLAGIPTIDELMKYHATHSHLYSSVSGSKHNYKPWKHRFRSNYYPIEDRMRVKGNYPLNNTRESVNVNEHSIETSSSSAPNSPLLANGMDEVKDEQPVIAVVTEETTNTNYNSSKLLAGEQIDENVTLEEKESLAANLEGNNTSESEDYVTNTNSCARCVVL